MAKLQSFKDNKNACYANVRMPNGDPIFVSVAQTGVVVKKSKLGLFGPKLYESRTAFDAATTAEALSVVVGIHPEAATMTNPVLRAFTSAVLASSTTAEVATLLNTAIKKRNDQEDLVSATNAIIAAYGDILERVGDEHAGEYAAGVYPESLLPIDKESLSKLMTAMIEAARDPEERGALEAGLAHLPSFVTDEEAAARNREILDLRRQYLAP